MVTSSPSSSTSTPPLQSPTSSPFTTPGTRNENAFGPTSCVRMDFDQFREAMRRIHALEAPVRQVVYETVRTATDTLFNLLDEVFLGRLKEERNAEAGCFLVSIFLNTVYWEIEDEEMVHVDAKMKKLVARMLRVLGRGAKKADEEKPEEEGEEEEKESAEKSETDGVDADVVMANGCRDNGGNNDDDNDDNDDDDDDEYGDIIDNPLLAEMAATVNSDPSIGPADIEAAAAMVLRICTLDEQPALARMMRGLEKLSAAIVGSSDEIRDLVEGALLTFTAQELVTWIKRIKRHIGDLLATSYEVPPKIVTLTIMLAMFYNVGFNHQSDHHVELDDNDPALVLLLDDPEYQSRILLTTPSFYYIAGLHDKLDFEEDYGRWRGKRSRDGTVQFAFCDFPFVLDPLCKSKIIQVEAKAEMNHQFGNAVLHSLFVDPATSPYFTIRVRRQYLIRDTLINLEERPKDLKKPLKVIFYGEQGVDEGGVRKELFLLLVRQLFDIAFGMFVYNEDTHAFWFNKNTLESTSNFKLVGSILGLAIYNSIILDVHFPAIVYKKLLSSESNLYTPRLKDVESVDPMLYKGLKSLLDYTEDDIEDVFCLYFQVEHEAFGATKKFDLIPGGEDVPVDQANKEEYVALYVQWLLSDSIRDQFEAFKEGFNLVCQGPALTLFHHRELETLVCGDPVIDFNELRKVCDYQGGYTADTPVVKLFWEVARELPTIQQKKLLLFATGSDRVPVGGMKNMTFVLQRSGPDTDRLPTSHTCFNVLLLPEYASKEKLKERMLIATNNAEGFGLI